jgi:hypothetical protein
MGIGDKVRAAAEEKAEQQMNADGKLSGRQLKELVGLGLSLSDARELAASGIGFDDIREIAEVQSSHTKQATSEGADISTVLQQNAAMMEKVIEKARNRRPESYNGDFPFPNISAYNPDGDASPAPPLKCEMWEGYWDERAQKAVRDDKIGAESLTKLEIRLLNELRGGEYRVENYDGEMGLLRVIATNDEATGALSRIVLAYPHAWVNKASRGRKKPVMVRVLSDVLDIGSHKASDIQRWLDAREAQAA